MHGMITIKLFDPYCMKSNKLSLIPNNIMPSFRIYFIQNLKPGSSSIKLTSILLIISPNKIAKIIGENGLFSKPNKSTPTKFEK